MFPAAETPRQQLIDAITGSLRLYSSHAQHIGNAFATGNHLAPADLHALIAIMEAERAGAPLTPGRLAEELNFSSSSVTALVDRLETAGHISRVRDTDDRRKVHLHYAEPGARMALEFFTPLARRTDAVMNQFTDDELETVHRFLDVMVEAMRQHRDAVRGG